MIRILSILDDEWDELVHDTDVFFQRQYLQAFTNHGPKAFMEHFGGTPVLIHYEDESGSVVHPVFMRRIGKYWDITSPYGYAGPAVIGNPNALLYGLSMSDMCSRENIITEFARHNPFLMCCTQEPLDAGKIVYIDLGMTEAQILASMTKSCRNAITSAEKSLVCDIDIDMEVFALQYRQTMLMDNAQSKYMFPRRLFDDLPNPTLFVAYKDGEPIASAIFLEHQGLCHYFLAASAVAGKGTNAQNLIIWEAMKWFKAKGCRILNLGGGIKACPGLLGFKESFSPLGKQFFVSKIVHNEFAYAEMCAPMRFGALSTGFFPFYRREEELRI